MIKTKPDIHKTEPKIHSARAMKVKMNYTPHLLSKTFFQGPVPHALRTHL